MDARSALFDLYGDHLNVRADASRGRAPVAALVRLLASLGVQAPAVRTAVSRMVRQGWLTAVRLDVGPGYALTPRAVRRLEEAAERIYRTSHAEWDGRWHLLVVTPPPARAVRERLHDQLAFLGYGSLGGGTWLSPRPAPELDTTLAEAGARAERFTAVHDGDSHALIARAWDLDGLGRSYARFLGEAHLLLTDSYTSTDEGAFCVGQDLVEHGALLAAGHDAPLRTVREHYNPLVEMLATMPKPVVAAINGTAAGAGLGLACACDFRIGAAGVRYTTAFTGIGLTADSGLSWSLPRIVGHGRATALLLLAEPFTTEQALEMGLLNAVVAAEQVLPAATELATRLAAGPTAAYACVKESLAYAASSTLTEALAKEDELQTRAGATADHKAATAAFLAKQRPVFTGR